jgi:1,2-dihydroxy-3-keto-5-methylthiopentene dioxygenase
VAEIRLRNTDETITGKENVRHFLQQQDVLYEHWDMSKLNTSLHNRYALNEEQKQEILQTYEAEIKDLAARRGYRTWDVIAMSEETPNLAELLAKFEQLHTHTDDEIRAIVSGSGVFVIKGDDQTGYFDVVLGPGEVISVPANRPHFFTLSEERRVTAVRLFINEEGWVSYPYEDPDFK